MTSLKKAIENDAVLRRLLLEGECPVHACALVCPRCIGAKGGKTTVRRHRANLPKWGRKGGRAK